MGAPPRGGSCLILPATLLLIAGAPATAAAAAERVVAFDVPAGRLAGSLNRIAAQADIDIVVKSGELAGRPTARIRGHMTVRQALDRLLARMDAVAVPLSTGGWMIARAAVRRARREPPAPGQAVAAPATEIVVSASKQGMLLSAYPGSTSVIDAGHLEEAGIVAGGKAIIDQLATLDSTHFGSGRSKLFIRGISDSGFLGQLQATVGQYLGDVRLTYGVPDPDLQLVDIAAVEVLEGPQGTLYGSGSLGGIVRVIPEAPDLTRSESRLSAGVSATAHGDPGADATLMLNLPLAEAAGLRLVGYSRRDGGYVDDVRRGVSNSNSVRISGMRGTLRIIEGDWSADLGVVVQDVSGADAAAVAATGPRLTRSGSMAQPYGNHYAMASIALNRDWEGVRLVSSTSLSRQRLAQQFDSTGLGAARASSVRQRDRAHTFSTETLLSGQPHGGMTWVAGLAIARHRASTRHCRHGDNESPAAVRVTNAVTDAALFGEATIPIFAALTLTGGLRLSITHISGHAGPVDEDPAYEGPQRAERRAIPSAGLFWQARRWLGLFGRYQQGFRAGGIGEQWGFTTRHSSDRISMVEAGVRASGERLNLDISLASVRWSDVQADVVTEGGNLVSVNVGTATIHSLALKASWQPDDSVELSGSFFLNGNTLNDPALSVIIAPVSKLPGVARLSGSVRGRVRTGRIAGLDVTLGGDLRYFGQSELGAGPSLSRPQGNYADVEMKLLIGDARRTLSLVLTNPFDALGNQLAFSTPYRLFDPQITPMRPRTLRLGFETRF